MTAAVRRLRTRLVALLLIITILLGGGCWDRREIEIIAFVNAVGVDRASSGNILVTFYTINPSALGNRPGGGSEPPAYVTSVEARDLAQALVRYSEESPRHVRFKQLQEIIIGEDLARQGVEPVMDYFSRREDARRSIWVLVAKGRAQEILTEGQTPPEKLVSAGMRTVMERRAAFTATRYPIALGDFLTDMARVGQEPIASSVELHPMQKDNTGGADGGNGPAAAGSSAAGERRVPVFSGAGVFRDGKLLDFLSPDETRGVLWVQGRVRGGRIEAPAHGPADWAALAVEREATDVKPVVEQDKIRFIVNIQEQGFVIGVNNEKIAVSEPETLNRLEREKEEAISQEVMAAVAKAQSLQSDFLGLGDRLYRKNPKAWEKVRDEWNTAWFPHVEVEVNVKCQLMQTGNTADPLPVTDSNR